MPSIFDAADPIRTIYFLTMNSGLPSPYNASTLANISNQIIRQAAVLKEITDSLIKDIRENGPSVTITRTGGYLVGLVRNDEVQYFSCRKESTLDVSQPDRFTSVVLPAWETHRISGFEGVWFSEDEANIIVKKIAELVK